MMMMSSSLLVIMLRVTMTPIIHSNLKHYIHKMLTKNISLAITCSIQCAISRLLWMLRRVWKKVVCQFEGRQLHKTSRSQIGMVHCLSKIHLCVSWCQCCESMQVQLMLGTWMCIYMVLIEALMTVWPTFKESFSYCEWDLWTIYNRDVWFKEKKGSLVWILCINI